MLSNGVEYLIAVLTTSHYRQILFQSKEALDPVKNERVIVGQDQLDRHLRRPPAR
jgi:hypothetical protein